VPAADQLAEWAAQHGKQVAAVYESQDTDFKKLIMDEINNLGRERKLNSLEKPKEIWLAKDPFSIENDILTPTFKLKRNVGKKVYQAQIDAMYKKVADAEAKAAAARGE